MFRQAQHDKCCQPELVEGTLLSKLIKFQNKKEKFKQVRYQTFVVQTFIDKSHFFTPQKSFLKKCSVYSFVEWE